MILDGSEVQLSIVIPAFNSSNSLPHVVASIYRLSCAASLSIEVVLVNDSSPDLTWDVIKQLSRQYPNLLGINLSRNYGQHAATICGCIHTCGKWVATIDDDLEQDPESILRMYQEAVLQEADVVYGELINRKHSISRNVSSTIARAIFSFAIPGLYYNYSSLRLIRGQIARELGRFDGPFPFIDGYLAWLTNKFGSVSVPHNSRHVGSSNYSKRKLISHALGIFSMFSNYPLRIASNLGFLFSVIGFSGLSAVLLIKLLGFNYLPGYASIMASVLMVGGLQLLVLGIIGEYIAKINYKTSKRPLYNIRQTTSQSAS